MVPDVTVLGKILGGGFGLAAFGGSRGSDAARGGESRRARRHHDRLAGRARSSAGGARANPRRTPASTPGWRPAPPRWRTGVEAAFETTGVSGHVRRVGSMLQPFFSVRPEREPLSVTEVAALQDTARFTGLCDALEERGVYGHRYPLGRWFVSTAHTDADIAATVEAVRDALADLDLSRVRSPRPCQRRAARGAACASPRPRDSSRRRTRGRPPGRAAPARSGRGRATTPDQ